MALTLKKQKFCQFYAKTFNAKKSALLAGYAESTAEKSAYKLTQEEECKKYIDELIKQQDIAREDDVLKFLTNVIKEEENVKIKVNAAKTILNYYAQIDNKNKQEEEIEIEVGLDEDED